jgi:hypothetical protein
VKVAKLREAERGCVITENVGVETRNCGIAAKHAKLRFAFNGPSVTLDDLREAIG